LLPKPQNPVSNLGKLIKIILLMASKATHAAAVLLMLTNQQALGLDTKKCKFTDDSYGMKYDFSTLHRDPR